MRTSAFIILLVTTTLILIPAHSNTILSFIVQFQEQTRQDFLQLTVKTSASDKSLEKAMNDARDKAVKLKQKEQQICRRLIKNAQECKGSAEIGNVQIEPKYETNKRETTFEKITATYTVLIKIEHVQKFGQLVDEILKMEGFVIEKIEWKADEDLIKNTFLAQSLEKSQELCAQLDQNFIRLVKVEELREEPEEPEEEEEPAEGEEEQEEEQPEQEEPQEEEEDVTVYRLTIECGGKKVAKKEKSLKKAAK